MKRWWWVLGFAALLAAAYALAAWINLLLDYLRTAGSWDGEY